MKFLVLFGCALAVASAGHIVAPLATVYTSQAQHLPVIGADGVPVDTAEVQHARAAHAIHKVDAQIRNGDVAVVAHPVATHVAPVATAYAAHVAPLATTYAAHAAYPTTAVLPASYNGVPLETPEVVAAKSNHFAAHAEALARNGHLAVLYRRRRGIYTPLLASTYAHHTPLLATSYAHQTPYLATSYAHAPLVASTYAGHYGYPYGYAAHYY